MLKAPIFQLLRRWSFLSYLAAIFITLLVASVVNYWLVSDAINSEVKQSGSVILQEVKSAVDNKFIELDKYVERLSQTRWVREIMSMNGSTINYERMTHQELADHQRELLNYKYSNQFYQELILYFNKKETALFSSMEKSSLEWTFSISYKYDGFDLSNWRNLLDQFNERTILKPMEVDTYGKNIRVYTYIKTMPYIDQRPYATFIALISENAVKKMLEPALINENAKTYILDSDNTLLTSVNDEAPDQSILLPGFQEALLSGKVIEKNKEIIFFSESSVNGWKYITVAPTKDLLVKRYYMRYLISMVSLFAIIACVLLGFFLSYRYYRSLTDTISNMQQRELIKKFIKGEASALPEGLSFNDPLFSVVVLMLNTNKEHDKYINGLLAEASGRHNAKTFLLDMEKNEKALMVNALNANSIYDLVIDIKQDFDNRAQNLIINIAVGGVYFSLENIPHSYQEAKYALDYKLLMERASVITFDKILEQNKMSYFYPLDTEKKIYNLLETGDYAEASYLLDQILNSNLSGDGLSLVSARCLFYDVLATVLKFVSQKNLGNQIYIKEDKLLTINTISQMREYVLDTFEKIGKLVLKQKESHNLTLRDAIKKYIDDNYLNDNLSLALVAGEFGVSSSYISRFFKDQFGCGFGEYVTDKRITKAKEFVLNGYTMSDIAKKVGYGDDTAFRKAFKKLEGITPSQYKNT